MTAILIVSPIPTHPTTAGNRARVLSLANSLSDIGCDVFFMHVEQEPGHRQALADYWGERYISVPYTKPVKKLADLKRKIARKLGRPEAYQFQLDEWYDPNIDTAVAKFLDQHKVDVVMVEYVFMSRALNNIPAGVTKVLDTHDVFTAREQRYLAEGMQPSWFSCSAATEARALGRADVVLAIQDNEAAYFRTQTQSNVVTIGHPADLEYLPYEDSQPAQMLMVGSTNPINIEGARWLVSEVMPKLRARQVDVTLNFAGTICGALESAPGINLLGRVEDLKDAYKTAAVVLNPMQFGTGLKIKSIEALGYGRPLVSTECGVEGLAKHPDCGFFVADTPDAFADTLLDLINNPEKARLASAHAFQYAQKFNTTINEAIQKVFVSRKL